MILTDVKWKSLLCGILILVSFVFLKPFPAWAGTDGTNNDAATAIEITAGQQVSTSIDYSSDQDWYKITVDQACSLYTTLTNNSGAIFYSILNYSQSQLSTKLCSTGTSNHYWKVTPGTYYIQISNLSGVNYTTSSISFNVTLRGEDQWENNDTSANAVQISSGQQYSNISIEAVNDNDWFKITVDHPCSLYTTLTNNSGSVYYGIYDQNLTQLTRPLLASSTNNYCWKVASGTYYICISDGSGINYSTGNISFQVNLREQDQLENNDVSANAVQITPGQQYSNICIEAINDYDWFKITVDHPSSLHTTLNNNSGGVYYGIYDQNLTQLTRPILASSTNKYSWKVASSGTYYICIYNGSGINFLTSNISFQVDLIAQDQWENNDVPNNAREIFQGVKYYNIKIEATNDYDWFKITTDHPSTLYTTLTKTSGDIYYGIYNQNLTQLTNQLFWLGTNTYSWLAAPGTYFIKISEATSLNYLTSNISLQIDFKQEDPIFLASLGKPYDAKLCGDPVNPVNGNYTLEQTDVKIPTRSVPLEFTRYYNSRSNYSGPLGKGWQHNYNVFLSINTDNSVSVTYPDGHSSLFAYASGSYTRPAGCFDILTKNADGTFVLRFKDQSKYLFSSNGKLSQIVDKNGNTTNLQYTNGLLTNITEPAGRTIQLYYDGANRIQQLIDPANRAVSFTYNENGNLATVQGMVYGQVTTYGYDHLLLTSITDPNNHRSVLNVYDSIGRITEQQDAKGNTTHYSYDTTNRQTTITDPRSYSCLAHYDSSYRVTRIDYPQSIYEQYTYDADSNRTSVTDKNAHTTSFTYDRMGNQLVKTDPSPLGYVSSTTYDSMNNPTSIVDAAGYTTNMTYDANGNLLTVTKAVYGGLSTNSFTYNTYGQITGTTDPNGKTVLFTYDQYGNRQSTTDPLGNKTTYTYDVLGRQLSKTDPRGNAQGTDPDDYTTTFTYDAADNLLSTTDPLDGVTTSTYDLAGNCTSVTDPRNHQSAFTYDENNQLSTSTDSLGNTTTYLYDASGNLASTIDPSGHITSYTYDFLERRISTTYPNGGTETVALDGNGNPLTKTDPNGNTTHFTYDVLNRLVGVTDALNNTISTQYDPLGNTLNVTDQRGKITNFTYDQGSRLLTTTDALNHTTSYTYDLAGNKLTMTNARGATWSYQYDDDNRPVTSTDPLGGISTIAYDPVGNVISNTDANGKTTSYQYNAMNKLVSATNALNNTTNYGYDANLNLISVTDANNHTTTYEYDALNRMTGKCNPLGQTEQQSYDSVGNLATLTKPDGTVVSYTYDASHRLTAISAGGQTQMSASYDTAGRRTSMTDPLGSTSYAYDNLNRLTSVTRGSDTVGYSYDPAGNRTGITYPGGLQVNYTFNDVNLPETISDSVYQTALSYDEIGNRVQELLPNGITANFQYDNKGRLTNVEYVKDGTTLASSSYTFDSTVNPQTLTNEQNQVTRYYYDDLSQLTGVEYPDGSSTNYIYDPVGNRTSANGTVYNYDAANHLTSVGDTSCTYDADGNLLSMGAKTYQYDFANRLTQFSDGTNTAQYYYDGDGIRTGMTVAGAVYGNYGFVYDINSGIPKLLMEKKDNQTIAQNIWGTSILSRIGEAGQVFYLQDGLGSTSAIADLNGQLINSYWYDAFGTPHTIIENVYNPFLFTGGYTDPSDLIYLNARYYDPITGRFLTEDTVMGDPMDPLSQNLYIYCSNNPVAYTDPSGNFKLCDIMRQPNIASYGGYWMGIGEGFADQIVFLVGYDLDKSAGVFPPGIMLPGSPSAKLMAQYRDQKIKIFANCPEEYNQGRVAGQVSLAVVSLAEGAAEIYNLSKAGLVATKGPGNLAFNVTDKIGKQMGKRGWTNDTLGQVVKKPFTTREAVNKATGNKATAYFNKDGSYVVKDNVTGDIIQVSNRNDSGWIPDPTIKNPYIPGKK